MTTLTPYYLYSNDGLEGTIYATDLKEARALAEARDTTLKVYTAWEAEQEDEILYDRNSR